MNDELSKIAANYEGSTELPKIGADELTKILADIGVDDEKLKALPDIFNDAVNGADGLTASNLVESKVVIKALGTTVNVAGCNTDNVRIGVRDGRKCLVIDLYDASVAVNDINVRL